MKENTVVLSLKHYNNLRKVELMRKKHIVIIKDVSLTQGKALTDEENVKGIADKLKETTTDYNDLSKRHLALLTEFSKVRNMGYWEFRKWRDKNLKF